MAASTCSKVVISAPLISKPLSSSNDYEMIPLCELHCMSECSGGCECVV